MLKEEHEEWMCLDEDIPVAAILTNLEICQAVCEQDQEINVADSDGEECVGENPTTNLEMRKALDILKRGVQHRSTNFEKVYENEQLISEMLNDNCRHAPIIEFFNCHF
ncbi:hypothetical protein AVEN_43607-1 [Araneus ventricosus]|uniref:Uncharacterized protein n=1 Tax=Araneus ventricosus TaxID=182803 RepID=A0A4Y2MT63_ARAVE|nr:hypothetical protein AVEN_43607-1 [Araneus ventricosus]